VKIPATPQTGSQFDHHSYCPLEKSRFAPPSREYEVHAERFLSLSSLLKMIKFLAGQREARSGGSASTSGDNGEQTAAPAATPILLKLAAAAVAAGGQQQQDQGEGLCNRIMSWQLACPFPFVQIACGLSSCIL